MDDRWELRNRVRKLRRDAEWSQAQLAARLGVSRQTVYAIEKGKIHPSVKLALQIAALFELPLEQVFRLERQAGAAPSAGEDDRSIFFW